MLCLLVFGGGSAWGAEADYTLTPSVGSNNAYGSNCDVTVGGIIWNVTGNAQMTPWRLGGKSITKVDRAVYSKTAYTSAVSKIDLTVGTASSITVNSLKLVYSTNADFSNSSEISKSFAENSTISFEGDFPANAYYKFVFNVTVSATSNKFLEFSKVEFYNKIDGGDTPVPTTYTVTVANNIANGTVTANPTSAKEGDEVTLTATPATGYEFGSWNVTNASTSAAITVTNNKFKMPAANVNVSATFNQIQGGGGEDTPTGSLVYKKVTSQADIVDGGVYIIVCESQNTAMGSQSTSRRNNASIKISDNTISLNSVNTGNSPYEVTLAKDGDIYKLQLSNGNFLGNGSASGNNLKEVQNYATGYGWTLTYNTDKTVTMNTNHTTARYLCVNTANADSYATYTSIDSYEKVTLYKKETSTPDNPVDPTPAGGTINFVATTGDGKYYATFSSDRAIRFDEAFINDDESCAAAIKAYAIKILDGQIYRTDQYKENNDGNYTYIPANTGILFEYSLEEGTFDGAVPFEYADAEAAYLNKVEDNMLVPCAETAIFKAETDGNYYYKLAYGDNTNKTKLGFWWGANDGSGNFKVKAGGAVLCVPQSAGAKLSGFVFGDDEDANSINNIPVLDKNATIYNLNGQRVNANAKGIVIVNGKKVLNK